jgi:hypothetical protein
MTEQTIADSGSRAVSLLEAAVITPGAGAQSAAGAGRSTAAVYIGNFFLDCY